MMIPFIFDVPNTTVFTIFLLDSYFPADMR